MAAKNEVAVQVTWKYDENGVAVPVIPEAWAPEYVEEESTFVAWARVGASLAGVLAGSEEMQIQETETFKYFFQTGPDFELVTNKNGYLEAKGSDHVECHGTGDLDGKMSICQVGDYVTIRFTDERRTNTPGRTFKIFEVQRQGPPPT